MFKFDYLDRRFYARFPIPSTQPNIRKYFPNPATCVLSKAALTAAAAVVEFTTGHGDATTDDEGNVVFSVLAKIVVDTNMCLPQYHLLMVEMREWRRTLSEARRECT